MLALAQRLAPRALHAPGSHLVADGMRASSRDAAACEGWQLLCSFANGPPRLIVHLCVTQKRILMQCAMTDSHACWTVPLPRAVSSVLMQNWVWQHVAHALITNAKLHLRVAKSFRFAHQMTWTALAWLPLTTAPTDQKWCRQGHWAAPETRGATKQLKLMLYPSAVVCSERMTTRCRSQGKQLL